MQKWLVRLKLRIVLTCLTSLAIAIDGMQRFWPRNATSLDLIPAGIYPWDMPPTAPIRTKVFQSNRSQAVRLPKDVAFPPGVTDVVIVREGNRRVIVPAGALWDDFFDRPGINFPDRDQPPMQEREEF